MTWEPQLSTQIPSSDGTTPNAYVSYDVGFESVVDEPIALTDFNQADLGLHGEAAVNIRVYSQPNAMGFRYYRGDDFDVAFATDSAGQTVTRLARSGSIVRWIVPRDPVRGFVFADADIVTMIADAQNERLFEDYSTVTLLSDIDAVEAYAGTNAQTVSMTAVPSATDRHHGVDAATVSQTSVPSAAESPSHTYTDAATSTEVSAASAAETHGRSDAATVTQTSTASGTEQTTHTYPDAATARVIGVPSTSELYTPTTVGTQDTTSLNFWNEGLPLEPYNGSTDNVSTANLDYWNAGVPLAPHNS